MCGWTVALVLLGLPSAARAMATFVIGSDPGWPHPEVLLGLLGISLPAVAFLTVRHRRLPWLLLTAATALLLLSSRVD